eukprot:GHVP01021451.1.p1 GENE.GHVP01021451.1~~GHVP01021451.1.p1  ORF type:complete len:104 (-),score=11.35 GHVP01021451.1:585-896(-)
MVRSLDNKSEREVAESPKFVFYWYGVCVFLQTDNGTESTNGAFADICSALNINKLHGYPNYPPRQEIIERLNQTRIMSLSREFFTDHQKAWIKHIKMPFIFIT